MRKLSCTILRPTLAASSLTANADDPGHNARQLQDTRVSRTSAVAHPPEAQHA
jgi:hypothetical protein